ncbi:hypothetical protein KUV62_21260 [Salipiger bermudensis]|uniref:hypothetical protein n=1 Tax=Salipiger bermudensis TaxID=344736 RepID=UPI001C98EDE4|nr:hypothetical protein [Salipiger bermudensis]MBY6006467.1 hypothetical protein [Salipiger bermudensis]
MKKAYIAFAALPVLFGAAGFAGGQFMPSDKEHGTETAAHEAPVQGAGHDDSHGEEHAGRSEAEKVLDKLASTAPEQLPEEEGGGHGHSPSQADAGHGAKPEHQSASLIRKDPFGDTSVVRLGRVSVPVYRPNSVTYVVSEVGVAMRDRETAEVFNVAENASRLRDVILASMHKAAGTSAMQGPSIDTEKLTKTLVSDLKADFGDGVSDVLFLSLIKADVPRS